MYYVAIQLDDLETPRVAIRNINTTTCREKPKLKHEHIL